MNKNSDTSKSKPLTEMREDLVEDWEGPEVKMTAAEREVWLKDFIESLEQGSREIAEGKGIPAEAVFVELRAKIEEKLKENSASSTSR